MKRAMIAGKRLGVVFAIMLATGCASVSKEQRSAMDTLTQQLASSPQAILVSGCVLRDGVYGDYLMREPSFEAAESVANAAHAYLTGSGMQITRVSNPLICGFLDRSKVDVDSIADRKGADKTPFAHPVSTTAQLARSPQLVSAYLELHQAIAQASVRMSERLDGEPTLSEAEPFALDESQRRLLVSELGSNYLWIVGQGSANVSFAKSFGTAVLTGVLSAVASGGAVIYTMQPLTGFGTSIGLVRLDRPALIWLKSTGPNSVPPEPDSEEALDWARVAFSPLLDPDRAPNSLVIRPVNAAAQAGQGQAIRSSAVSRSPAIQNASVQAVPPNLATVSAQPLPSAASLRVWQAGDRLQIKRPLALRFRPTVDAEITAPRQPGAEFDVARSFGQGAETWYYLKSGKEGGWVQHPVLQSAVEAD